MGIVFRQSIKSTIVTLTGAVLGAVCNLAYVNVLDKQLNGFRSNLFIIASILQLIVLLGTAGTLLTYVQRYPPGEKRRLLQTVSALVPLVASIIIFIPYFIFREEIILQYLPDDRAMVGRYYILTPVLTILWAYVYQMELYLGGHHKSAVAAFIREILIRGINIILIILFYYDLISFSFFITGCVAAYALAIACLIPVVRKTEGFGFTSNWKAFTKEEYKELARFSWYHMLMAMSLIAMANVGAYMLGIMSKSGLDSVSVYSIAIFVAGIVTIPFRAMTLAAYPTINKAYAENDMDRLKSLFRRSGVNTLIVSVFMAILIACNLNNVLPFIRKGYDDMVPLTLIMLLGWMFELSTGLNSEMINISKYYRFNYRISVLLVLLLVLFNYLLIPRYDIFGAAWGTVIAFAIFNAAKVFFLWRKMGLHPFSKQTPGILLSGVVAGAAGYLLPYLFNSIVDALIRSAVIVGIYGLMILWLKPSEDIQTFLESVKKNKRLF